MSKTHAGTIPPIATVSRFEGSTHSQQLMLTVRVAAERLGKSTGSIYKLDRVHGPFRFAKRGRRIYIDAASFERYLAGQQESADSTGPDMTGHLSKNSCDNDKEVSSPVTQHEGQDAPSPARIRETGSGQRELTIRPGRHAFLAVYTA